MFVLCWGKSTGLLHIDRSNTEFTELLDIPTYFNDSLSGYNAPGQKVRVYPLNDILDDLVGITGLIWTDIHCHSIHFREMS